MRQSSLRKAVMVLVLVFLGGFFLGVLLSDQIEELPIPFAESDRDYDDDVEDVIDAEQRLLRRLQLTAEQQRAVNALLQQREDTLVGFWSDKVPAMNQIIERSRDAIRGVLTPAQRARYERGLAELLRRQRTDD